jgi:hypothetical protein
MEKLSKQLDYTNNILISLCVLIIVLMITLCIIYAIDHNHISLIKDYLYDINS